MQSWKVQSDGIEHLIQWKDRGSKVIVDGNETKVKSSNPFMRIIDYPIKFNNTNCQLVVVGRKAELAVNGYYLDSKKPYEPMEEMSPAIYVFIGITTVGGWFIAGLLGFVLGITMATIIAMLGAQRKNKAAIALFCVWCVLEILLRGFVGSLIL